MKQFKSQLQKNWLSWLYTTKNSTVFKSRRRLRTQVADNASWGLARYIPFSIDWRRRDLSNLDGVTNDLKNVVELEDATTGLQEKVEQPSNLSSHSEQTCFNGSLHDCQEQNIVDLSNFAKTSDQLEELAKELERRSGLENRLRKYRKSDPSETWSSRWIAAPVAYLFPKERREEWLGDLMDLHRELQNKDYPAWLITLIDIGTTIRLILSAIEIKLTDLVSQFFGKKA